MTRALGLWRHNHVEKQMRVTVNQSGQESGVAQINCLRTGGHVALELRRRADLFDLSIFDQYGGW